MKIAQIRSNIYFKGNMDLADALGKAIAKKINRPTADTFTPATPSQPIIIDKLEIKNGSSKKEILKDGGKVLGGTATGYGIYEAKDHITHNANHHPITEDETETNDEPNTKISNDDDDFDYEDNDDCDDLDDGGDD